MTYAATVLADAAPTGAGLAIVLVILLGLFAIFVGGTVGLTVFLVRRSRRRRAAANAAAPPSG